MAEKRKPGLDLIRAFAILLVVFHHYRHLPGCPEWLRWFSLRGYIGVDLFFVLSGWLIGGQLIRKYRATGQVEVFRFWTRRWFRTLPCYFFMLGVLWYLGKVTTTKLPDFFVFFQNYTSPGTWLISWSLCVEEHFYITLPILFLLLPLIVRSKTGWFLTGLFFVFISPLLRYQIFDQVQSSTYGTFLGEYYGVTHLRFEGLAIGVALAVLAEYHTPLWLWMERHAGKLAIAGVTLVILATWSPQLTGTTAQGVERMAFFPWVLGFFFVSVGTGMALPLANRAEVTGIWIKPITLISEHAYTLYLVHEFGRDIVRDHIRDIVLLISKWFPTIPFIPPTYYFSIFFLLAFILSMVLAISLRLTIEVPGLYARDLMLRKYSLRPGKFFARSMQRLWGAINQGSPP